MLCNERCHEVHALLSIPDGLRLAFLAALAPALLAAVGPVGSRQSQPAVRFAPLGIALVAPLESSRVTETTVTRRCVWFKR